MAKTRKVKLNDPNTHKKRIWTRHKESMESWREFLEQYHDLPFMAISTNEPWTLSQLYDHLMKVAETYQLYYFHRCYHSTPLRLRLKNPLGILVLDFNVLPKTKIKLEHFPLSIRGNFIPENASRKVIISRFERFMELVNRLEGKFMEASAEKKSYHPMFGWLNAVEWFSLIEIHFRHHLRQKNRIESAFRLKLTA
jgi:hypothetical protein